MENNKYLMTLSTNGNFEFHPKTTKKEILCSIMPVLFPDSKVPSEIVKTNQPGMDDIAVCFMYPTPDNKYTPVTRSLCSIYGITIHNLIKQIDDTPIQYSMNTIDEALGFPESGLPMYVITNEDIKFGSGGIILSSIRRSILNFFHNTDFYVLPSSIHEMLVIPSDRIDMPENDLVNMVQVINRTTVNEPDRLSDHVYKVNHEDMSFSTISI